MTYHTTFKTESRLHESAIGHVVLAVPSPSGLRADLSDNDSTVVPQGTTKTMLTATILRTVPDFESLVRVWPDLLARSAVNSPFLSWTWIRTWLEVYLPSGPLIIIVIRDNDKTVAIAPFWVADARRNGLSVREIRFLGSEEVCPDHLDIVADLRVNGDALDLVWRTLFETCRHEWDVAQFADLAETSRWGRYLLRQIVSDNRALNLQPTSVSICPYASLPGCIDAYQATLGSKTLDHMKRSRKQLLARGNLRFERIQSAEEVDAALDWLIRVHRARWRRKQVLGSFEQPRFEQFHRLYCQRSIGPGELALFTLRLDDRLLSVAYCLLSGGKLSLYQHTSDLEYDPKLSIGRTMQGFIIEYAIAQGWNEYDLLRGDEEYKYQYASRDRRNVTIEVSNCTARALGVQSLEHLKGIARATRNWLRTNKSLFDSSESGSHLPEQPA